MYGPGICLSVNREFSVRELRDETSDVGEPALHWLSDSSHCVPKIGTVSELDTHIDRRMYICVSILNMNRDFSVRELRDETSDDGEPA